MDQDKTATSSEAGDGKLPMPNQGIEVSIPPPDSSETDSQISAKLDAKIVEQGPAPPNMDLVAIDRHLTRAGKLTLKLLKEYVYFFDALEEVGDIEDLVEDERFFDDHFRISSVMKSDRNQIHTDNVSHEFAEPQALQSRVEDTQVFGHESSTTSPLAPSFQTELYRFTRSRGGDWTSKLVTKAQGAIPEIVAEQLEDAPSLTSTFEVTAMYALGNNAEQNIPMGTSKSYKALTNLGSFMVINSPLIIDVLRGVAPYYPMVTFEQSPLPIVEPYCLLLHYQNELKDMCKVKEAEIADAETSLARKEEAKQEAQHLSPLVEYISRTYDATIAQEKARWAKDPPMCTFEWLWLLFKPGSTVISWKNEIPRAYTVQSHDKEEIPNDKGRVKVPESLPGPKVRFSKPKRPLSLIVWSINFDGERLGREQDIVVIPPFDGERIIHTLPVAPVRPCQVDQDPVALAELEKRLVLRGKEFVKLTTRTYCEYFGKAVAWPNRSIAGRVMIDTELRYSADGDFGDERVDRPELGIDEGRNIVESIVEGAFPGKDKRPQHRLRSSHPDDNIDPKAADDITDNQYMICCPTVWGFVTKLRRWELLNVEEIQPLAMKADLINDLVLDENAKNMIKALAHSYTTQRDSKPQLPLRWSADFVQNKGDGQIFLLHGKPGVGKTTTAECAAELTGRPLLSLTCGDLGISPIEVERQLMRWLRLGTVWEAILLLDEADIYLESRRAQDLQRNSLVSIFLRALEYYQGILLLTSNRVGAFDDAFVSRIHVIIYYPPFEAAERARIWSIFFRKLERERLDIRIHSSVFDFVENDEVLKNLNWNGREIRNAFNTSVALADYENETVEVRGTKMVNFHRRHLEQVVKMSRAFQVYLEKTHGMDEARRAKVDRIRHDVASIALET